MRAELGREILRKTWHMASLAYLAAYKLIGYPRIAGWLAAWSALVAAVEFGRLYVPRLNELLFKAFGILARPEERGRVSGILHTTLGALLLILAFGRRPAIVAAGLLYVALGDAAAALVGKSLGRHRLPGSRKSIEGSLGCFAACAAVGWGMGFPAPAVLLAAATATGIELLPTTALFNDNLWMPVGTAVVLSLCL